MSSVHPAGSITHQCAHACLLRYKQATENAEDGPKCKITIEGDQITVSCDAALGKDMGFIVSVSDGIQLMLTPHRATHS